jgi:glycoprotein-N-acetylgalactosamine 3-beta-galactosyltransferase
MTNPSNHGTKAVAVQNTWGRHCDRLVFMSTTDDDRLQEVWLADLRKCFLFLSDATGHSAANSATLFFWGGGWAVRGQTAAEAESRQMLWEKSKQAWMRAYRDELEHYDWFLRGDDDTYIVRCRCSVAFRPAWTLVLP